MANPGEYSTNTNDMLAVHAALRTSLASAPALVAAAGDDPEKVAVVATYCDNVLEFLHVHHEGEDELVYPVLVSRCTEHAELLQRIDDQHKLLNEPMATAKSALAAWQAAPSAASGDAVSGAITEVSDTLLPHLAEEETQVLPIASCYLTPEEWGVLPGHALQNFAGDKPWLAVGLIREHLTEEQRAEMLASMPPPVQQLWTDQWEPAYTGFIAGVRSIDGAS